MEEQVKAKRGFAAMNPERAREIQRMGAAVNHKNGTAHRYTSEEARAAGKKGAEARRAKKEAANAA
jgi:general stress protein YciG